MTEEYKEKVKKATEDHKKELLKLKEAHVKIITELAEKSAEYKGEIRKLTGQIKASGAQKNADDTMITSLNARIIALNQQQTDANANHQAEKDALVKAHGIRLDELAKKEKKYVAEFDAEKLRLNAEIHALTTDAKTFQDQLADATERAAELQLQLDASTEALQQCIEEKKRMVAEYEKKESDIVAKLERFKKANEKATHQLQEKIAQREADIRTTQEKIATRDGEIGAHVDTINANVVKIAELERKIAQHQASAEEYKINITQKLKEHAAQKAAFDQQFANEKASHEATIGELTTEKEQAENKLAEALKKWQAKKQGLNINLQKCVHELGEERKKLTACEAKELTMAAEHIRRLGETKAEYEQKKQEIANTHDAKIAKLEAQIAENSGASNDDNKKMIDLRAALVEAEKLSRASQAELRKNNDESKKNLADQKLQFEQQLDAEKLRCRGEITRLTDEHAAIQKKCQATAAQATQQLKTCEGKNGALSTAIQQLNKSNADLQQSNNENKDIGDRLSDRMKKNVELKKQNDAQKFTINQQAETIKELTKKTGEEKAISDAANDRIGELESQLEELKKVNRIALQKEKAEDDHIVKRNNIQKNKITVLTTRVKELQPYETMHQEEIKRNIELSTENAELQSVNDAIKEEAKKIILEFQSRLQAKAREISAAHSTNSELNQRLKASQELLAKLQPQGTIGGYFW